MSVTSAGSGRPSVTMNSTLATGSPFSSRNRTFVSPSATGTSVMVRSVTTWTSMIDGAPTTTELNGFSVLYIEATPSRISTSGALPVGRTRATGRAGAGAANGLGIANCAEQMSLASHTHENATSA